MTSTCTKDMPRAEWLALRTKGIGGSDAAAACGLSPWKTAYGLWLEKAGHIKPADDEDEPRHLMWGRMMESAIIEAARHETGLDIQPHEFMTWSREYPWAFYDPDGIIGADGLYEAKITRQPESWGGAGTDDVPLHYLLQVQHGMAVMGRAYCILAVSVYGAWPTIYRIERDEDLIDKLMAKECAFWGYVERKEEPPLDHEHPAASAEVKKAFPGTDGTTVKLPDAAMHWHEAIRSLAEEKAQAEKGMDALKTLIRKHMGNAAIGLLPDGTAYTRKADARGIVILRHTKKV